MQECQIIQFQGKSEAILKATLLTAQPQEGCAILLGQKVFRKNQNQNQNQSIIYQINLIWPCKNDWKESDEFFLAKYLDQKQVPKRNNSKNNRFIINPTEQIQAQKWARNHNLDILGYSHSHPNSPPIPSEIDVNLTFHPGIMVIVSGSGKIRAWLINKNLPSKFSEIIISRRDNIHYH